LSTTNIAARCLRSIERSQHTFRKIAFSVLERARHRRPNFIVEHQVRLYRKIGANDVTRGLDVILSSPCVNTSLRIDHRHLSDFASFILCQ